MKKFQISMKLAGSSHAGSKAPNDAYEIAQKAGYKGVHINYVKKNNIISKIIAKLDQKSQYLIGWIKAYITIPENALVFFQIPNEYTGIIGKRILLKLKEKKHVKLICLIHDIDELRLEPSEYLTISKELHDFVVQNADIIIVHNNSMLEYLAKQGISREKMVVLEVFDYLADSYTPKEIMFEKSITIAGNLDATKSGYISQLRKLTGIKCNLYGPNYDIKMGKEQNISYCGVVKPEVLPEKLDRGFGLIWDGNSIETCNGNMGNYLRYNNPHKLSLYLASGLPVVIWKQAAEASFVEENGVGICVDSLMELEKELENMGILNYESMTENVEKVGIKLRQGYHLTSALQTAEGKE